MSTTTKTVEGPVTEIALLRLKQPLSAPSAVPPSILKNLAYAASQQLSYSTFPVTMYHCVKEDAQLIYLVGGWRSISTHMDDWIPGATNQELMKLLSDDIDVDWMFHLDVDPKEVNAVLNRAEGDGSGVVAFGRHTIRDGAREEFLQTFDANKEVLEEFIGGKEKVVGGWRLDQGYDPANATDEGAAAAAAVLNDFILMTVWPSVEQHLKFADTEGFKERYGKIRPFIEKFDVKHCNKLDFS